MSDVDDYVRWFGKQKPQALMFMGVAILAVSLATYVFVSAYIELDDYWTKRDGTEVTNLIELLDKKNVIQDN